MAKTKGLLLPILFATVASVIAQAQTPNITGLANNATTFNVSSTTPIAPGELVNIFGTNLGDATGVNCGSPTGFSTTCGTVSVTVSGKAAGVRSEGSGGLLIEVPVDAPLGNGKLVVTHIVGGQNLVSQGFAINVVAYAPELYPGPVNTNNVLFGNCFNMPANTAISPLNPAGPGGSVRCVGTGFGATNPVSPTGTVPTAPLPNVVAKVTVAVGGENATVTSATLQGPIVGEDQVFFNVPLSIFTGNQPLVVSVGGISTITFQLPIAVAGPNVTSVSNSASNILPGLPNAGIAQGSIFILKGSGLGPTNISIAPAAFQTTSLGNTSVAVTVGSTTVNAPMYYTSDGQVAALLPSNTPVGVGSVTVTYSGQAGNAAPVTVVANNLGIFTVDSSGQGPGIVTYADYSLVSAGKANPCGGPNTSCGAANPGDTLILWATGLGPVSGSDASGAGLGVAINVPLTLWLGGVAITPSYQGRSGCCIGEDQIVFTVPSNVPTGCAVPLLIQINNEISNNTVMPIANGSRNCTPSNPALASVDVEQAVMAGPITFGSIRLQHNSDGGGIFEDDMHLLIATIPSYTPGSQPFFTSYADDQPLGTCLVFNDLNPGTNIPAAGVVNANAGASFTVKGPNGSVAVPAPAGDSNNISLNAMGTFLVPGAYTVTGTGGPDVGAFSSNITIPALPTLVSPVNNGSATRSNGMTVTWTGGSGTLQIVVQGATDNTNTNGAVAICTVDASAGTLTIPPYILQALPAGNFGGVTLTSHTVTPFTATGLGLGIGEADTNVAGFGFGWGSGSFTLK